MPSKLLRVALAALALIASSLAIISGIGPSVLVGVSPAAADDTPAGMPLSFVEAEAADGGTAYLATGPSVQAVVTDDGIEVGMAGTDGQTHLALELVEPGDDRQIHGSGTTAGVVNHLIGDDPETWSIGASAHVGVGIDNAWHGIDMRVRGDAAALKYEFIVSPGADVADIALRYGDRTALRIDDAGNLVIDTGAGPIVDAAPTAFQVIGGERVGVAVAYRLDGGGTYGFDVGDHDPDRDLIIDPAIEYGTFLGGGEDEFIGDITRDSAGNIIVVGTVVSRDFPTLNALSAAHNGGARDAFVAKFSPDGTSLIFSTFLGGSPTAILGGDVDDDEAATAVAVDGAGNIYVAGTTSALDFPTAGGSVQTANRSNPNGGSFNDGFFTKLSPTGGLLYSTYLGGFGQESVNDVAIGGDGSVYLAGSTTSADFPLTAGAMDTSLAVTDGFVTRLPAALTSLSYSTLIGGSGVDTITELELTAAGVPVVAGATRSADFPTTAGTVQTGHAGPTNTLAGTDIFVAEVQAASGGGVVWGTYLGGSDADTITDLEIDGAGVIHLTGNTSSSNFPTPAGGAFPVTASPSGGVFSTGFYARLASGGSSLPVVTHLGGATSADLALAGGDVWLTGTADARLYGVVSTTDAEQIKNAGNFDAWVGRVNSAGTLAYSSFLGGIHADNGIWVDVDATGDVWLAGSTASANFPVTADAVDGTFQSDLLTSAWRDLYLMRQGDGGGVAPPPPPPDPEPAFETQNFSGRLRDGSSTTRLVNVGAAGDISFTLDWDDNRADVDIEIVGSSGATLLADSGSAMPKTGSVATTETGTHTIRLNNPTGRDADYTLSVTYPVSGGGGGGTGGGGGGTPALALVTTEPYLPATIEGGFDTIGRVFLDQPAAAGGATVSLSTNNALVSVPATVTIPEGQRLWDFPVTTSVTPTSTTVTVSATYEGVTRTWDLRLRPIGYPTGTVAFEPSSVLGGESSTGTIFLSGPAPQGGVPFTLSSDSAASQVPASITVPEGQTQASFTVTTSPVTTTQLTRITIQRQTEIVNAASNTLEVRAGDTPPPPPVALQALFVPPTMTGGITDTGAAQLDAAAPTGGLTVALSSSNAAALSVPRRSTSARELGPDRSP